MPVKILTGESNLAVFYRLQFPNGYIFKCAVVPLDTRTARDVLGNVTEDYTLIIPITPVGVSWPFLAGMRQSEGYVTAHTGINGNPGKLLTQLIPTLTRVPPVDDLIPPAEEWYAGL